MDNPNTERIAKILANHFREDDGIVQLSLVNDFADYFEGVAAQRKAVCMCGPDCLAEDCNFDREKFLTECWKG